MRLYLVQHGEALSKDRNAERPLSPVGESDLTRMAEFLARAGVGVTRVIHSGKLRAEQSALILAEALAPGREPVAIDGINPNDDAAAFARKAKEWSEDAMVVGHLPFMGRLAGALVGCAEGEVAAFLPGSVACLERCNEAGVWRVAWMMRPELLGEQPLFTAH